MHTTSPSRPRRLKTLFALACALAGVTCAHAYAHDATIGHAYGVQMQLAVHGHASAPLLTVEEDKPFAVAGEDGGKPWRAEFVITRVRAADGAKPTVRLAGSISEDGKLLAKPTLIGALGERMAVQVGDDVKLALVVKDLAP